LLRSAAERGEVRRDIDFEGTVTVLFALADGLSWRRAVEPSFDAEGVMPIVLRTVEQLLVSPAGDQKGTGELS
jgi:TetR/AcrR family transcriptional regulator, repressor for uid operon